MGRREDGRREDGEEGGWGGGRMGRRKDGEEGGWGGRRVGRREYGTGRRSDYDIIVCILLCRFSVAAHNDFAVGASTLQIKLLVGKYMASSIALSLLNTVVSRIPHKASLCAALWECVVWGVSAYLNITIYVVSNTTELFVLDEMWVGLWVWSCAWRSSSLTYYRIRPHLLPVLSNLVCLLFICAYELL